MTTDNAAEIAAGLSERERNLLSIMPVTPHRSKIGFITFEGLFDLQLIYIKCACSEFQDSVYDVTDLGREVLRALEAQAQARSAVRIDIIDHQPYWAFDIIVDGKSVHFSDGYHSKALAKAAAQDAVAAYAEQPQPATLHPKTQQPTVRGVDPQARQKVIDIVANHLADLFDEYLAENIGDDILTVYDNGFLVTQLVSDISAGILQWVTKTANSKSLNDHIYGCCEEYLDDEEDES